MAQAPALVARPSARVAPNRISLPLLRVQERRLLLAVVDAALAGAILLGAYELWKNSVHPAADNMAAIPWAWVIGGVASWLAISWLAGSYDLEVADRVFPVIRRCLTVAGFAVIEGLGAYLVFLKTYPRPALAIALPAVPIAVLLWRTVYASALHRPMSAIRTIVVGNHDAGKSLAVEAGIGNYYRIVGQVEPENCELTQVIEALQVQRVVVAPGIRLTDSTISALTAAVERGVEVLDFNSAYEEMAGKVAVDHAGDHWLAALPTRVSVSAFEEAAMRLLDLIGMLAGGVLTVAVFPLIAGAIALTSRGPVIYRQTRVGRAGRNFTIYKFRTMSADAEAGGAKWADHADRRVTPVGRFLRRTHLDELPQLWNVMKGEMSLVGPRPERPEFTDELAAAIPFYRLRLSVRPGLTGLKQIKVGYASNVEEHLEVLRHDLYYIKHRSLALNLTILARTLGSVVGRDGR